MSRVRVMDDFKKTSLRAMNGQCLGILVNDTNMSGLCSAQHVIFIEMTYKKKKKYWIHFCDIRTNQDRRRQVSFQ